MIHKSLDVVTKADIDELIATQRLEDRQLEYKRALPGTTDEDKKEFLADVTSFANAAGGDIVFGVEEAAGVPLRASGVKLTDFDAERLRLMSLLRDGVQPRIPALEIRAIYGFADGPVLVARIHQSWAAPHMVTFKNVSRFYMRAPGQRHQMDVQELRAAFIGSEASVAKARAFRDERIGKVLVGLTPVPIQEHPTLVVHVMPIAGRFSDDRIEPRLLADRWQFLNASNFVYPAISRFNLEGLLITTAVEGERRSRSYMQLFRNGTVESVATYSRFDEPQGFFAGQGLESQVIKLVDSIRDFFAREAVDSPLSVTVSLLRFRNFTIMTSSEFISLADHRTYDRDTYVLPDVVILDCSVDTARACRPLFDSVWQAAGFSGSPYYDQSGDWQAPRTY